jgi:uncharacterized protein
MGLSQRLGILRPSISKEFEMKGTSHPTNDVTLAESASLSIRDVINSVETSRRQFVKTGLSATALASAGGLTLAGLTGTVQAAPVPAGPGFAGIGFESIPAGRAPVADMVTVPNGYTAELFVAWGDPIMPGAPAFAADASQNAAAQAKQFGAHTDGMHLFPFTTTGGQALNDRGLLVTNHEYTHEEVLFPDGQVGASGYSIAKTRKSQAAHGLAVTEARRINGKWTVMKNSSYGRRVTGNTFIKVSGPAAGHALMKTNQYTITDNGSFSTGAQTDGKSCHGTLNNCGHGVTPWGTYLSGEENFNGYFGSTTTVPSATSGEVGKLFNRYGITAGGFGYRWHTTDPRFDVSQNPNEPNMFGWVVEMDPYNPRSVPVKRTAMGRFKHEGAWSALDSGNNVAFYMGDDERNEYIYKFVCAGTYNPNNRAANMNLLDEGTLYVAKFNANGTGQWIALQPGTLGSNGMALRDNPNFAGANDAEVLAKILIKTRMAGDAVGATMMDRPEWTGVRPRIGGFDEIEAYCTLTNNNRRGGTSSNAADGSTTAGSARPPVDAANPRANNLYGGVIRWREDGKTVRATTFTWDLFIQNGDVATTKAALPTNDFKGSIVDSPDGSADYGAPDGIWFDQFGRLWVQTDQQGDALGDWVNIGANSMVCVDPNTGMTRRFLNGPRNCEVTGVVMTPDGKTMFVGIQHPGEEATAANPEQFSTWPAGQWPVAADGVTSLQRGRPRSGVVVITKDDGGVIGS